MSMIAHLATVFPFLAIVCCHQYSASDCMEKMNTMSKKLEVQFGPDTSELSIRMGMHSGPVTGGFMKGKQSRFQLFGDTMTTASLIHETGERNCIHMSEATANLLITEGRSSWVTRRDKKIHTAEIGELQTYWMTRYRPDRHGKESRVASLEPSSTFAFRDEKSEIYGVENEHRWIEWNTEQLLQLLRKILARQDQRRISIDGNFGLKQSENSRMPLDEVVEIIDLPDFDREAARRQREKEDEVQMEKELVNQVRELVTIIAGMYNQTVSMLYFRCHSLWLSGVLIRTVSSSFSLSTTLHTLHT